MGKNDQKENMLQKLQENLPMILSKYPSVLSAYLFGSAAQGVSGSFNDIDIAIRLDDGLSPESNFDIRFQLTADFETKLGRKTDIVVLNNASLKLIHQIIGKGRLLFAQNREEEMNYILKKQKEYFDFKYYIKKDIREMKAYYGATR